MLPLVFLLCCIAPVVLGVPLSKDDNGLINDINLEYEDLDVIPIEVAPTPVERGQKFGYMGETHEVVTEDGHILQVHRLVGSLRSPKANNKPPVLLIHGLMDCSATWVMGTPKKSLGYILADWGYDVWMGNVRGNRYSRNHKWMSTKDEKYWMFSWHEIGVYDLPAMIDHILEVTKQKKIMYIGHSQGGTAFLVMASERPEYQEKIEAAFPLAPAAHMSKATNPAIRILAPIASNIKKIGELIGIYELQPSSEFIQTLSKLVCKDGVIISELCSNVIFLIGGASDQLNKSLISEVAQYDPAGAGVRQFVHYAQLINSGGFLKYDHGLFGNLRIYGQVHPPKYNVANIKIPVYLFYSSNDQFVHEQDLRTLYKELPNAEKFLVPLKEFSHLDFVWGKDVDTLLYNRLLSRMEVHRRNM